MSSVVKSAGKVFRKVGKALKKIAPYALAAGAVIFTAGAALGVSAVAGGWGAAASSLSSSVFGTGALANIATGALTQAGYGAAIGAASSAITGGDPAKGALAGAVGGAVSGGVMGGLGWSTDPLAGAFDGQNAVPPGAAAPAAPTPTISGEPANPLSRITGDIGSSAANSAAASPTATPPAGGGGFFNRGGWLERNGEMVGGLVKGAAGGLMQGMAAGDEAKANERLADKRAANYRTTRGLMTGAPAATVPNGHPTVAAKYDPLSAPTVYRYNPETGEIERQALA